MSKKKQRSPANLSFKGVNIDEILFQHFGNILSDDIISTNVDLDDNDENNNCNNSGNHDNDNKNNNNCNNTERDISINELMHEKTRKSKKAIYFLDSNKNQIKYWISMFDVYQKGILPQYTNIDCWWCRLPFDTHPIGCPLKYHYHKNDGIEKERFEAKLTELNMKIDSNEFFETEGNFCSFPCVKSYIRSMLAQTKSSKYKEAFSLLTILYLKLKGEIIKIPFAPSWKTCIKNMGHLTNEQYRETFDRLIYEDTVNTCRPFMFSSSSYVKEKRLKI